MATRTVSAAGGVFTATGTWVGGVAPATGDDIVANATSGNLTLGANTNVLVGANFTGYTGTLALGTNNFRSSGTVTLGASMSITASGSGQLLLSGTPTLVSNNVLIAGLGWSGPLTLSGDARVYNILPSTPAVSGSNMIFEGPIVNVNALVFTAPSKLILKFGATATLQSGANGFTGILRIERDGVIVQSDCVRLDSAASGNVLEIKGNVEFLNALRLVYNKAITSSAIIDTGTYSFNFAKILFSGQGAVATLNVISASISVDELVVDPGAVTGVVSSTTAIIQGTYSFSNIKNLYVQSYNGGNTTQNTNSFQRSSILTFKGGLTHSVSERLLIGGPGTTRSQFGGLSPSTTNIYFTGFTYSISSVEFFRVNFTSTNVPLNYLSSANVLVNASATGLSLPSGGGGGSFTFVN